MWWTSLVVALYACSCLCNPRWPGNLPLSHTCCTATMRVSSNHSYAVQSFDHCKAHLVSELFFPSNGKFLRTRHTPLTRRTTSATSATPAIHHSRSEVGARSEAGSSRGGVGDGDRTSSTTRVAAFGRTSDTPGADSSSDEDEEEMERKASKLSLKPYIQSASASPSTAHAHTHAHAHAHAQVGVGRAKAPVAMPGVAMLRRPHAPPVSKPRLTGAPVHAFTSRHGANGDPGGTDEAGDRAGDGANSTDRDRDRDGDGNAPGVVDVGLRERHARFASTNDASTAEFSARAAAPAAATTPPKAHVFYGGETKDKDVWKVDEGSDAAGALEMLEAQAREQEEEEHSRRTAAARELLHGAKYRHAATSEFFELESFAEGTWGGGACKGMEWSCGGCVCCGLCCLLL